MAFTSRYNKYKEENGSQASTDAVWQNSIQYLQLMGQLDEAIHESLSEADLTTGIQLLSQLMIQLEKIIKKKEDNGRSEEYNRLMPQIDKLQWEIITTPKDAVKQRQELYLQFRDLYVEIGNLQYKLNLIFKQGIDPVDWWAEG